ncbi:hypothetical protein QVD17_08399, partial [Tagetes erecta]
VTVGCNGWWRWWWCWGTVVLGGGKWVVVVVDNRGGITKCSTNQNTPSFSLYIYTHIFISISTCIFHLSSTQINQRRLQHTCAFHAPQSNFSILYTIYL